jgi:hypothetical protein
MNNLGDTVENLFEASWKIFRLNTNSATSHITNATRRDFQHAVTGKARAGVYPEDSAQLIIAGKTEKLILGIVHGVHDVITDIGIGVHFLYIIQIF